MKGKKVDTEDLTLRSDGKIRRNKGTVCTKEEDRTRQSDKEAADINRIVHRFATLGETPRMRPPGAFADVSAGVSYHEMANQVREMEEYFMELDPRVRGLFENDSAKMVRAFHAGEQKEVFMELGVIPRAETSGESGSGGSTSPPPPAPVGEKGGLTKIP